MQKDGVCTRLHATDQEDRATTRAATDEATDDEPKKRSRSAPPKVPQPQQPSLAQAPRAGGKRRKKGRLTLDRDGFVSSVKAFNAGLPVKDRDVIKKGLLQALAGTNKLTILPVGQSKTTKSKENATAALLLNGVAKMAAGPMKAEEYRNKMVVKAFKQQPNLHHHAGAADNDAQAANNIATRGVTEKELKIKTALLDKYAATMKTLPTPKERRPFLALFAGTEGVSRTDAIRLTGVDNINEKEWHKARLHSRYPGPLTPAPKMPAYRQRIPTDQLEFLLNFLESPGNLQRYAFGSKLLLLCEGTSGSTTVEIDNVDRLKKVEKIAVEYIMELDATLNGDPDDGVDLEDDQQCQSREKASRRRCRKKKGHTGKHKFTSKNSLSITTVSKVVKLLTGNDIKRLAGLDDTKVLKGRENFKRMAELAEKLCSDVDERKALLKSIEDAELYHLTDFQNHLMRAGNQKCCCLSCGFCEPGSGRDGVKCDDRESHNNSCVSCAESFGVIDDLKVQVEIKKEELANRYASTLERNKLDDLGADIDIVTADLREYRSHLARHKAEGDFDAQELKGLADDSALVICDFKMKLLSCFFRENQLKFFGKRGTGCLGFMIVTSSRDPDAREKGIKEVKFVMMFTDDTNQDEQAVASAKHEIYTKHLPGGVTKVHFHSDGAGCFKSAYHKVVQPLWKVWTGIDEVVNRVTPAGGGKTALDGMFGRTNTCLASAVDGGLSHHDAQTVCEAMEASEGLSATTILLFSPRRIGRLFATFATANLESVLRSELNQDRSLTIFKHSGYGTGRKIFPSDAVYSLKCKPTKPMINNDVDLLYQRKKQSYLSPLQLTKKICDNITNPKLNREKVAVVRAGLELAHFQNHTQLALVDHFPRCLDVTEYGNKKKDMRSVKALAGEGYNHPNMRQERKEARVTAKTRKDQLTMEDIRTAKAAANIKLCPVRCPETFHYCRCEFLTELGLTGHLDNGGNHDYPTGVSAGDKAVRMASNAGGVMAIGSRTNRKATGVSKIIPEAVEGAKGSSAAACYQQFNRKENRAVLHKTEAQIKALEDIFYGHDPKLTPAQARDFMRQMIDTAGDGGLMFCYSKRGTYMAKTGKHRKEYAEWQGCQMCGKKPCVCNGILLPEGTITSYFSSLFASQKKRDGPNKRQAEKDATQAALIENLNETPP